MTTTIRSLLSLILAAMTITSAFAFGVATPAMLISFGLLVAYGVIEIALVSYQSPDFVSARRAAHSIAGRGRNDVLVPFQTPVRDRKLGRAA